MLRLPAPYFLSLAAILLDRKGVPGPLGKVFSSVHSEIRGSADGTTIVVVSTEGASPSAGPGRAARNPVPARREDMLGAVGDVVAWRRPEGDMLANGHVLVASHLEHQAGLCFPGEHVYSFVLKDPDGGRTVRHVAGTRLREAKDRLLKAETGHALIDLERVRTPAGFAAEMPEGTPVDVTDALRSDREWEARKASAPGCPHEVYAFSWRPAADAGDTRVRSAPAILALDLSDAESALRRMPDVPDRARIVGLAVATMGEYLASQGKGAPEPVPTPAVSGAVR
jgi:hypothetical protein